MTFGIERFDDRETDGCLNDAGGDVDPTLPDDLRERERGIWSLSSFWPRPLSFSEEPPTVRREIILCRRPDFVFVDSNEITLVLRLGDAAKCGSSGGPSSRNAIKSRAARETYGLLESLTDVGETVEELERMVFALEVRIKEPSISSSESPIISSISNDSGRLPIFLVLGG